MIKILCVGNLKEKYWQEAVKEYEKRLSRYHKIMIVEVPEFSQTDVKKELEKQRDALLKQIKDKDFVITLEIEGKMLSSVELSEKLEQIFLQNSDLVYVIGGSNGLHEDLKKRSNFALLFSKMTFPHQ